MRVAVLLALWGCLCEGYTVGGVGFAPTLASPWRGVGAPPRTGAPSAVRVSQRARLGQVFMMAPPGEAEKGEQALLWADGLSKTYDGQKYQFRDATFVLSRGERVGLIGVNGVGKSTLLKILARKDDPDGGGVSLRKGIVMAYVEQDPLKGEKMTVGEALYAGDAPVMKALREFEEATAALTLQETGVGSAETASAQRRFEKATERMETSGAWDIQVCAEKAIDSLLPMLKNHMDRPVSQLSGGQRKRLALASALLQKPDLLLLDEPTNHLDVECIEWLENELQDPKTCLLMVTHDRYFLEKTCAYILELDSGSMYRHEGCYSSFLEARAIRDQEAAAQVELAKKQARKELEWVRRMPKAREAKNKARVARYYELEKKSKSGKGPASKLELDQGNSNRLGNYIMELDSVSVELPNGATMLRDFSYEFMKRDRIGIVGPNGVGKTTFLNLLAGRGGCSEGELKMGETVVIGYYEQNGLDIDPDLTVLEYVAECGAITTGLSQRDVDAYQLGGAVGGKGNDDGTADAFKLLDKFQFPRARCYERVGSLSGGERRRLQLLGVLVKRPNVLLLDEPSNDLDITTLGALENYLREDYDGVLAVVSHDRAFMDQVADHLFVFEGDGLVRNFEGRFSEFLEFDKERKKGAKSSEKVERAQSVPPPQPPKPPTPKAVKLNYKEKREWERLEAEIEKLSKTKSELEVKLNAGAGGFTDLTEWGVEVERLTGEIEEKELRWLELAELVQGA